MKAIVIKFIEQALIVAVIAILSFAASNTAALGPYGPIVGAVATVLLGLVNKLAGKPVEKVAAAVSPRPF